jgi:anti-sigma factor RsiW
VTCDDVRDLLHAYVDGELDLVRGLETERHLQECPECSQASAGLRALRTALRAPALRHEAPPGLHGRIQASIRRAARPRTVRATLLGLWAGVAAALALIAFTGWALLRAWSVPSAEDLLAQEVVSNHVRSQLAEAPLVAKLSSKQHEVGPWFNGKLDFHPTVKNLDDQDFKLVGGRLDVVDNRTVAALVYQRRKHFINVFEWPAGADGDSEPKALSRRGFNLIRWTAGDLTFWAVSDLNAAELRQFVELMRN